MAALPWQKWQPTLAGSRGAKSWHMLGLLATVLALIARTTEIPRQIEVLLLAGRYSVRQAQTPATVLQHPSLHVFSALEVKPPTGLEMVSLESATVSRLTEIPRRHISSRCEITVDIHPVFFLKESQLCQLWLHNNNTEPCTTQKRISKRDNNRGSHH